MSEASQVDLVITGGTVVSPSGTRKVGIAVDAGKIVAVTDERFLSPATKTSPHHLIRSDLWLSHRLWHRQLKSKSCPIQDQSHPRTSWP